jgi:hypothetical protein
MRSPSEIIVSYRHEPHVGEPFGWPDAFTVGAADIDFGVCITNTENRARRIVASWNLCRMIPVAQLEQLGADDFFKLVEAGSRLVEAHAKPNASPMLITEAIRLAREALTVQPKEQP